MMFTKWLDVMEGSAMQVEPAIEDHTQVDDTENKKTSGGPEPLAKD